MAEALMNAAGAAPAAGNAAPSSRSVAGSKRQGRGTGNSSARSMGGGDGSGLPGDTENAPKARKPKGAFAEALKSFSSEPEEKGADREEDEDPPAPRQPAKDKQKKPEKPKDRRDDAPRQDWEDEDDDRGERREREEAPRERTKPGADYSRQAENEEEEENADPALAQFAERFGLTDLDSATKARNAMVEHFGAIIGATPPNPARPAAGNNEGRPGQPRNNASGPPQNQPAPAHSPQAGNTNQGFSDEQVNGLIETYGPEFKPVAELLKSLTQGYEALHAAHVQQRQQQAYLTVDRFFAGKVRAGFRDKYGSKRDGLNQVQTQARKTLLDNATVYQQRMAEQGHHLSDDEALEAAFQYDNREAAQQQARDEGRQEVERQVRKRHQGLDLVGGGNRGGSARGEDTGSRLAGSIKSFLNHGSRR